MPAGEGPRGAIHDAGSARIRISRIHYPVTVLGPGRRLGIWVQGCPLACRGCVALDTWDPAAGYETSIDGLSALWREAVADGADGLTVSGGEPLVQPVGLAALLAAVDRTRSELTSGARRDLDILVYTGYELDELGEDQRVALAHVDALITGRYDVTRPTTLIWRGSANQRIVPLTPLGWERYAPYVNHTPERAAMQVAVHDGKVWLIGVPRHRDMPRLERALRDRGVTFQTTTWRP